LWNDYEQLRSYALSPTKSLSHPIGLDLWCKKGFLSWIGVLANRDYQVTPVDRNRPIQHDKPNIPAELATSLANIITEWSDSNV